MDRAAGAAGAMQWASAHSVLPDAAAAADEAAALLEVALGPGAPDLLLAFFGPSHVRAAEAIAEVLRRRLAPRCFAAASAHGVVTREHELEAGPALSVIAARLPGVEVSPFILASEAWAEAAAASEPAAFESVAPGATGAELLLLVGDPFSLDLERVLAACDRHAPSLRVVGGMASAGVRPGSNALLLNDWCASEGGFAIALSGALRADVVVSQGCRPIGPPLEVTRVEGHLVLELDGRSALARTEEVLQGLAESERAHLKHGLYVGRPARGGAAGRGDYLIRNLLGADRDRGAIAIGDRVAERERLRLHVRDAETAREDLEMLLSPQVVDVAAGAALVFACNGRGRGLHGRADGDIGILQSALGGGVPAAGMFCAGEIGPVAGNNFVHGHTASIAIVRPAARADSGAGGRPAA
jgi:small ligand-binding sensory domain FIST